MTIQVKPHLSQAQAEAQIQEQWSKNMRIFQPNQQQIELERYEDSMCSYTVWLAALLDFTYDSSFAELLFPIGLLTSLQL